MDVIHDVTRRGDVNSLKRILNTPGFLIAAVPDFTSFDRNPLHIAAIRGHVEFARVVVNREPQLALVPDSLGLTPLHLATARNDVTMVKALLNANTDACVAIDQDGRTPLHIAARRNKVEVMRLLIRSRPQAIHQVLPNTNETLLHLCVKHDSFMAMKKLVDYLVANPANLANIPNPISVNSVDSDGNTILHLAAQMKRMKMLKYLLGSNINTGIDVNIRNTTPEQLRALDMLDENEMDELEFGCDDTEEITQQSNEWLRERLNTLMIVATLIGAIAFQAVISPPGGVFQEDLKIDSVTDPIMFTYYVRKAIDNPATLKSFRSYYSHLHYLPPQKTTRGNITTDETLTYRAKFVEDLLTAANTERSESFTDTILSSYMSKKFPQSLVLEDYRLMNITSKYNATYGGGSGFSPYLICYAGTNIMAYTSPKVYESFIILNSVSLYLCGMTILIVTFDAIKPHPSGSSTVSIVRVVGYLEVLLCIAVVCVGLSYAIVVKTVRPPFYDYRGQYYKLALLVFGFAIVVPFTIYQYDILTRHPLGKWLLSHLRGRLSEYIWLGVKFLVFCCAFIGLSTFILLRR